MGVRPPCVPTPLFTHLAIARLIIHKWIINPTFILNFFLSLLKQGEEKKESGSGCSTLHHPSTKRRRRVFDPSDWWRGGVETSIIPIPYTNRKGQRPSVWCGGGKVTAPTQQHSSTNRGVTTPHPSGMVEEREYPHTKLGGTVVEGRGLFLFYRSGSHEVRSYALPTKLFF